MRKRRLFLPFLAIFSGALGCPAKRSPEDQALYDVKGYIDSNLRDLIDASQKLAAAAPEPDDDGWSASADPAAVAEMKAQWKRARVAYEHVEGAIAVLFPDLDYTSDQRYDAFLADQGPDTNLFDDDNVTGIHAIERILWSDSIPERVVTFEKGLAGYAPASFPQTRQEAGDFKDRLCALLVADAQSMREQFRPLALDPAAAFRGVIGSMQEQLEKADKAATGEEESRYAQYTLADMRANVSAGRAIFGLFEPWLREKGAAGADLIAPIHAGFDRLEAAYAAIDGDALPPTPEHWNPAAPTPEDLATPFGQLWSAIHREADPETDGSLVQEMNRAADALGIPVLGP